MIMCYISEKIPELWLHIEKKAWNDMIENALTGAIYNWSMIQKYLSLESLATSLIYEYVYPFSTTAIYINFPMVSYLWYFTLKCNNNFICLVLKVTPDFIVQVSHQSFLFFYFINNLFLFVERRNAETVKCF